MRKSMLPNSSAFLNMLLESKPLMRMEVQNPEVRFLGCISKIPVYKLLEGRAWYGKRIYTSQKPRQRNNKKAEVSKFEGNVDSEVLIRPSEIT